MTREIRRRHKIIWLALTVLLPVLLLAAVALRHAEPVNETIPERIVGK